MMYLTLDLFCLALFLLCVDADCVQEDETAFSPGL